MTRRVLALLGALGAASCASAEPFASSSDASYVVQLHASRDGYTPPESGANVRSQLMTTESGQQFECFLPSLTADATDDLETAAADSLTAEEEEEKEQKAAFLAFGRAAAQKSETQVRPVRG